MVVSFNPFCASLTCGDGFALGLEGVGRVFECLLFNQFFAAFLAAKGLVSVFRKLLHTGETLFFRCNPVVLGLHKGLALPEPVVIPPVNVAFSTLNRVFRHGIQPWLQMCKFCVGQLLRNKVGQDFS